MPSFECDQVAELQETFRSSGLHEALAGKGGALRVRFDVACKVEDGFDRQLDQGFDDDFAHESFSVAVRLKTSRPPVESGSTQK